MPRRALLLLTAAVLTLLVLALVAFPRQITTADASAATLRTLLESRLAAGQAITLQFERPFLGGETLLTLPDAEFDRQLASVGADYLCISEPWNNTRRIHCTPFANLVSASYED
jgi:hypothetical protein